MQNVRGMVLVLLAGLAGESPAVAEPPHDIRPAAEAFERLEGTWSRKPQGGQEESIVVCFDRKDGRVTRSIIKLTLGQGPRSVYLSEVKIRTSGQKGVITLGETAGIADLPEEVAYVIDGDTLVLAVGSGALKGEYKLRKER